MAGTSKTEVVIYSLATIIVVDLLTTLCVYLYVEHFQFLIELLKVASAIFGVLFSLYIIGLAIRWKMFGWNEGVRNFFTNNNKE